MPAPDPPLPIGDLVLRWWVVLAASAAGLWQAWQRWVTGPRVARAARIEQLATDIADLHSALVASLDAHGHTVARIDELTTRIDTVLLALATHKEPA